MIVHDDYISFMLNNPIQQLLDFKIKNNIRLIKKSNVIFLWKFFIYIHQGINLYYFNVENQNKGIFVRKKGLLNVKFEFKRYMDTNRDINR